MRERDGARASLRVTGTEPDSLSGEELKCLLLLLFVLLLVLDLLTLGFSDFLLFMFVDQIKLFGRGYS